MTPAARSGLGSTMAMAGILDQNTVVRHICCTVELAHVITNKLSSDAIVAAPQLSFVSAPGLRTANHRMTGRTGAQWPAACHVSCSSSILAVEIVCRWQAVLETQPELDCKAAMQFVDR